MSIFDSNEPIIVSSVGGDIPAGEVEKTVLGAKADELAEVVDVTVDGEYAIQGEVKIVMTVAQMDKLAELLERHVDRSVVALDNGDPEGARFIEELVRTLSAGVKAAKSCGYRHAHLPHSGCNGVTLNEAYS